VTRGTKPAKGLPDTGNDGEPDDLATMADQAPVEMEGGADGGRTAFRGRRSSWRPLRLPLRRGRWSAGVVVVVVGAIVTAFVWHPSPTSSLSVQRITEATVGPATTVAPDPTVPGATVASTGGEQQPPPSTAPSNATGPASTHPLGTTITAVPASTTTTVTSVVPPVNGVPFPTLPPVSLPPPSPRVTLFPVSKAQSQPFDIVLGPDGNLWFTEGNIDVVASVTPQGVIREYHTPTAGSQPGGIAVGPDGNVWFTEMSANKIGRITGAGAITEFQIPTANSNPRDIAAGADGAMWFTEYNRGPIGRATMNGQITEYPGGAATPMTIAKGADGTMWFGGSGPVMGITQNGTLMPLMVPIDMNIVLEITVDHLGNLWYAGLDQTGAGAKIDRVDAAGHVTSFPIQSNVDVSGMAEGPDGAIWFAASNTNYIGRLALDGTITTFSAPSPVAIVAGPDGNMWFTSGTNGNAVGRLRIG
jgi:streptogramin lyase